MAHLVKQVSRYDGVDSIGYASDVLQLARVALQHSQDILFAFYGDFDFKLAHATGW